MLTLAESRAAALALLDTLADYPPEHLPPDVRAAIEQCRADLQVVVAASDAELSPMLERAAIDSFEALRGLLQRQ